MFSRRELVLAIYDATARTIETFESLAGEDWTAKVEHEPTWTTRDVLAHLAGSGIAYALLIETARQGVALESFDREEFMQVRLADRATVPVADLLTEYRTVQVDLIRQVATMSPALLEHPVRIGSCWASLDSALFQAAALHALRHRAQVIRALTERRGKT